LASPETPDTPETPEMVSVDANAEPVESIESIAEQKMELFSVYKFSMDYPPVCRFEFNPKTKREKGDIVLHFPDREKIFLSWGPLPVVIKKYDTAQAFADHSIKSMTKSRSVSKSERLTQDTFTVNSHEAYYNKAKFIEAGGGGMFGGRRPAPGGRITCSVHFYCPNSSRYFVIYALLSAKAPEDFDSLFLRMVHSFKCH